MGKNVFVCLLLFGNAITTGVHKTRLMSKLGKGLDKCLQGALILEADGTNQGGFCTHRSGSVLGKPPLPVGHIKRSAAQLSTSESPSIRLNRAQQHTSK